ncbi:MAG: cytochrome-c peroxidase [Capnocytophaga sp.]|nr:cytochrome-c peroxidase [Capnocytophaga sp.]
MKYFYLGFIGFLISCNPKETEILPIENPKLSIPKPSNFPDFNPKINLAFPTQYGVELGFKLFNDPQLSGDNSISCASCHIQQKAFADGNSRAIGVKNRVGLRNTPPIQNMAFLKTYMWDGAVIDLKDQPHIPIETHEEMDSSMLEIIQKLKDNTDYQLAFQKAFGDKTINTERILSSLAQYMYTLISANSKYDKVTRNEGVSFTDSEQKGYNTFQNKCASCHKGTLQTDESFRNIGFPHHPDTVEEHGRARVTGFSSDFMKFRVPSLRNVAYTAPYGSFGQFATLKDVLDYFDQGVLNVDNLDPILKNNGNRIPLTEEEKENLIAFMKTLSDEDFTTQAHK